MNKKYPESRSKGSELSGQGWVRRFVADEPRLSEAVELYRSLGFEVRVEPAVFDEIGEECQKCLLNQEVGRYGTIYTRRKEKK